MVALLRHHNRRTGTASPSQERIAACTGLTSRTVRTALGELEDMGWIQRQGRPSKYRLNVPELPWKGTSEAEEISGKAVPEPEDFSGSTRKCFPVTPEISSGKLEVLTESLTNGRGQHTDRAAVARRRSGAPELGDLIKRGCALWEEATGGVPAAGRIGKAFKQLLGKGHSVEEIIQAWENYLHSTDPKYASPEAFAAKFGVFAGSNGAHPNGRPSAPKHTPEDEEFVAQLERVRKAREAAERRTREEAAGC